jgi:ankyrin repeat protein
MYEISLPARVVSFDDLSYNQQFLLAAYRGNTPLIVKLLAECHDESFDPNCFDDKGFTALHAAAARGYEHIVIELLKSKRVKNNVLDKMARHPIEVAWKSKNVHIVEILYESLPANTLKMCSNKEKEHFIKMLFTSDQDIMGQCFDLGKLKEISARPRKAYDFL